jgi:type IV pilus assembly protein PilB
MMQFKDDLINLYYHKALEGEDDLIAHKMSDDMQIPFIDLSTYSIEFGALGTILESDSREHKTAAFHRAGRRLYIAMLDPKNPSTKSFVQKLTTEGFILTQFITTNKGMQRAWTRYSDIASSTDTEVGVVNVNEKMMNEFIKNIKTVENFKEESQKILAEGRQSISKIFEIILAGAYSLSASDIHIEPNETEIRVRYRLDGVLHDTLSIPIAMSNLFKSRLKILSGVKLNQATEAQDGRFSIRVGGGKEVEVRVSLIPGNFGESAVMRLLDPDSIKVDLEQLGYEPYLKKIVFECINKPNGIILLTGPTGSGKTTTLYACLQKIYTPDLKIITIENPIEYKVSGIVQTQVENNSAGYTFATAMRAILRQDPDVIMVGEIRDGETADTAVNASLTGHLVFSSLHTNTAAGVIPRLIGMGVNPKILGSALTLSLAQRLLRRVCKNCKYTYDATPEEKKIIDTVLGDMIGNPKKELFVEPFKNSIYTLTKGKGCYVCNGFGYKGRLAVHEGIFMNAAIEALAATNPSEREIRRAAADQGFLTLREDALLKIFRGETTIEEAMKIVDMIGNVGEGDTDA